jgi:hypothetical protein
MESVQITFNFDPDVLKEAGVDLDSGTLIELKQMMLKEVREQVEALRESLRFHEAEPGDRTPALRRRLALIEAFTSEG